MKRKLTMFLACFTVLSLSVIYGGGRQSGRSGTSAAKPEISITVLDRGQVAASEGTYEDNRWTRWINENSPVRVRWVPILVADSKARINTLFAAGTAPDVVWEYGKDFMDNLYYQEVIQPVGEYIEKYSTSYKAYQAKYPIMMPYLIADDGQQYGISTYPGRGTVNFVFIRQDWLDKFGMSMPVTIEEAVTFMRRVRDEDPDGNGVKDTWGLVWNNYYLNTIKSWFGAPYPDFIFDVQNGHFVDWQSTPGYRAYLEFMAMCYREGFINPEFISDTQNMLHRQALVTGKGGIFVRGWITTADYKDMKINVPTADPVVVHPFTTSFGRFDDHLPRSGVNGLLCLNNDAKNPEAYIKFVDWQISLGFPNPLSIGFEGVDYVMEDGFPVNIPIVDEAVRNQRQIENIYRGGYMLLIDHINQVSEALRGLDPNDPIASAWTRAEVAARTRQLEGTPQAFVPFPPSSATITTFHSTTETQISSIEARVIAGQISVDEGLRQINAVKNAVGVNAVNAEKDAWYQKNKALFESLKGLY
jgi:putative aldouronate transport system substrate-binding protein